MTSDDPDPLLAAVIAQPEDDLPRLVYADWLEESGHPARVARARFIRAQIDGTAWPVGSPERAEFETQARDLARLYAAGWEAELPGWCRWSDAAFRYHRGFPSEWAVTPRRLFQDVHELSTRTPIDTVHIRTRHTLTTRRSLLTLLRDWPWMTRIRTLKLGPWVKQTTLDRLEDDPTESPEMVLLARVPRFSGVSRLVLADLALSDAWVVALATAVPRLPFAGVLAELDLSRNAITDAGAHTLATARGLASLQKLDLRGNRMTSRGVEVLQRRFGDRVRVESVLRPGETGHVGI